MTDYRETMLRAFLDATEDLPDDAHVGIAAAVKAVQADGYEIVRREQVGWRSRSGRLYEVHELDERSVPWLGARPVYVDGEP